MNKITYTITGKNSEIGQIAVTYFSNGETLASYAIDVPIVDGVYITGSALDAEIMHRAPVWLLERKAVVAEAVGFDDIQVSQGLDENQDVVTSVEAWEQFEFEKRISSVLIKFGILDYDPTEIQVIKL